MTIQSLIFLLLSITTLTLCQTDDYIVVLKPETNLQTFLTTTSITPSRTLSPELLTGFTSQLTSEDLEKLSQHPSVKRIEKNSIFTIQQSEGCLDYDCGASWNLCRVSNKGCGTPESATKTHIPDSLGSGVNIYVIDTGVRATHHEFTRRVSQQCYTAIDDGNGCDDCNGHGTWIASIAAGYNYGLAKQSEILSVRVLSCSGAGTAADIIDGLSWVSKHCRENGTRRCVAIAALGGGKSDSLDEALNNAVKDGIFVTVPAGGGNQDACQFSPAGAELAFTVGATGNDVATDPRYSASNYGKCLALFAPGQLITGAWFTEDTRYVTISGTSASAGIVAGIGATLLGNTQNTTVEGLKKMIVSNAIGDCIPDPGEGSPNLVAHLECPVP